MCLLANSDVYVARENNFQSGLVGFTLAFNSDVLNCAILCSQSFRAAKRCEEF
jgi:hypothetical protein